MATFPSVASSPEKSPGSSTPTTSSTVKPGHRTTEFLVWIVVNLPAFIQGVQGKVPPKYEEWVALASTIAYTLSRTIVKRAAA